jgi:hypothetical protein
MSNFNQQWQRAREGWAEREVERQAERDRLALHRLYSRTNADLRHAHYVNVTLLLLTAAAIIGCLVWFTRLHP